MSIKRLLIFTGIGLLASLIIVFFYARKLDFFYAIDLKLKDVRFRMRGEVKPDPKVVVVAIDGKSVNELGRWPWDRLVMAKLIENLNFYGTKTIALDIVFSEPSNPGSDKALAHAMKTGGNVIGGYFFRQEEEGKKAEVSVLLQPSKIKIIRMRDEVKEVPIVAFPFVETNIPNISLAASSTGFFNIIPDGDGTVRTSNVLMLYEGDVYPSLDLSALRHYLRNEIILDIAQYGVDRLTVGEKHVPVDEAGRFTLNYYGKQGAFTVIHAVDVIKQRLGNNALKEALVFVGPTEIGIGDIRATPLDPVLPGVEIHATVVSNVLQNRFLIRDGRVIFLEIVFIVFFPFFLSVLLGLIRRTIIAILCFLAVAGLYLFTNYFLFTQYLLNMGIIFPLISTTLTYLGSEAYRNIVEERQGRFMKKAFSSYVSSDLVAEIIKDPSILKLGGDKREITVLFADIRSFTTLSEKLTPESLVSLLNQYLGPMTNLVLTHRGTLDKYIGDAIMAIFNAPLKIEHHQLMACKTALEMIERLKEINVTFKKQDFPEIDIGIGVNAGDAVVGNMGTDVRFDYTAIGDTVNLASRLEGLNKMYKTHIIVSEFTVNHIRETGLIDKDETLRFRKLDLIKVKGKDKPVTIYELSSGMEEALIQKFEEGLSLYKKGDFKGAKEVFSYLVSSYNDKPSSVYVERCEELIEGLPDSGWDGVYVAKTK